MLHTVQLCYEGVELNLNIWSLSHYGTLWETRGFSNS